MAKSLILASASPRRKELLCQLGLSPEIYPVDIDETPFSGEGARDYVARMSTSKASKACLAYILEHKSKLEYTNAVLIASDTAVIVDDQILGKPIDQADFERQMALLSGRQHEVLSSIAVLSVNDCFLKEEPAIEPMELSVATKVKFKALSTEEITNYWLSGEPQDKAGGYGIQGKGAVFVEGIEGSYSNVVGLPLKETSELLKRFGIDVVANWA